MANEDTDIIALLERGRSFISGAELLLQYSVPEIDSNYAKEELALLETAYDPQTKEDLYALLHVLQKTICNARGLEETPENFEKMHKLLADWEAVASSGNFEKNNQEYQDGRQSDDENLFRQDTPIMILTSDQTKEWLDILEEGKKQPSWFKKLDESLQKYYKEKIQQYKQVHAQWETLTEMQKRGNPEPNLGSFLGFYPTTIRKVPGSANCWAERVGEKEGDFSYKIRSGYVVPFDMIKRKVKRKSILQATKDNIKQQLALAIYLKIRENLENGNGATIENDFPFLLQNLISLPMQPGGVLNPKGILPGGNLLFDMGRQASGILNQALKDIKKDFDDPENIKKLLEDSGKFKAVFADDSDDKKNAIQQCIGKIDHKNFKPVISFSNRPVNSARLVSQIIQWIPGLGLWTKFATQRLHQKLDKLQGKPCDLMEKLGIKKEVCDEIRVLLKSNAIFALKKMDEAINALKETPELDANEKFKKRITELEKAITITKAIEAHKARRGFGQNSSSGNAQAEMAALEQIIFGKDGPGMRAGSCVSGKDREEMIGLMKIAMEKIFKEHGEFPPVFGKEPESLREQFEDEVVTLFMKEDGPGIAYLNSPGAKGLKNIKDVLGESICEKINQRAKEQDRSDNYWQELQSAADNNKIKYKKTDLTRHNSKSKKIMESVSKLENRVQGIRQYNAREDHSHDSELHPNNSVLNAATLTAGTSNGSKPAPKQSVPVEEKRKSFKL